MIPSWMDTVINIFPGEFFIDIENLFQFAILPGKLSLAQGNSKVYPSYVLIEFGRAWFCLVIPKYSMVATV